MGRYPDSRARRLLGTKEKKRLPQQSRRGQKLERSSVKDNTEEPESSEQDKEQ